MNIQTVLFDMDGTVLNTVDDLCDSVNAILTLYGLPPISAGDTARYLGNGARHLIECAVPAGTDPAVTEAVLADYVPYYKAHCRIKTAPYAGILPLMERLRAVGIRMAIVSNKPDAATRELSDLFFGDLVDVTIGETPEIRRKPAPDTVLAAMRRMNADPETSVYIGDTEVDIETARNSGIGCISVDWGFRSEQQLLDAGASAVAHSPEELERLLVV